MACAKGEWAACEESGLAVRVGRYLPVQWKLAASPRSRLSSYVLLSSHAVFWTVAIFLLRNGSR